MHLPLPVCHLVLHGLRLAAACWLAALAALLLGLAPAAARAQNVELALLQTSRAEGGLNLEFLARVNLPRAVESALQNGVPIYFVAEAQLLRNRWYWRDERISRVSRSWRIAYQPLTGTWRVGLGGFNQTHPSLSDALTTASRSAGWKLADLAQLDPDKSYTIDFTYRLDTTQLPGPMQFGLGNQGEWAVSATRSIRVEPGAP